MRTALAAATLGLALAAAAPAAAEPDWQPVQRLLDLSGLAWLGDDRFLVVHDAKNPDELDRVRVSFLKTPASLEGMLWAPLDVAFPDTPSSDLESASRVPGAPLVLLVESNDDAGEHRRIFLARVDADGVAVEGVVPWTGFSDAFNVEATAVAPAGDGFLFLWAERASGQQNTVIRWSPMTLDPFAIAAPTGSAPFALPEDLVDAEGAPLYSRPIVAMDIDAAGGLHVAAAYDPEGTVADPDNGPFRSALMRIGTVSAAGVALDPTVEMTAVADGLKIESVAAMERDGETWLFIGTDDENYGGTLRRLPH